MGGVVLLGLLGCRGVRESYEGVAVARLHRVEPSVRTIVPLL